MEAIAEGEMDGDGRIADADFNGDVVVFDDMGAGVDRKDAKKRALELIAKEEPAYRKGE